MKATQIFRLLVFGILIFFSCSKEEDWTPDPIVYDGEMMAFQLAKIHAPNLKSKEAVFEGSFGNKPLTLGKYGSDSLIFIVPELAAGNQQLTVQINGKEWIWLIDIASFSNTVPVPNNFVEAFIFQNELLHTEIMEIGNGLSTWADDYEKWLNSFKQDYSQLSIQEKELVKGVFSNANTKFWFEIFESDNMIPDCSGYPMVTYLVQSGKFDHFNFKFFEAFSSLPDTQLYRTVLLGFGLAMWHQHGWLEGLAANTFTCPLLRGISLKKDINGSMNPEEETSLSFETGESAGFWIFGKYQLPNLQDIPNTDDFVGDFVRRYDTFEALRKKSNNILSLYQEAFDFSLPLMAVDPLFDISATANVEEKPFEEGELTIFPTVLENPMVRLSDFEKADGKVTFLFESLNGREQLFDLHFYFGDKTRTGSRVYPSLVKVSCPMLLEVFFEGDKVSLEILYGKAPYTITWSNGMSGTEFTNLPAGEYTALVVDADGCERSKTFVVPEYGTLTDIDGNVYKTVKIGNQWWMAENLRTSRKRDGTVIPEVLSNQEWQSATGPAFAWYDNQNEFDIPFGKLYNANASCCDICPEGWHLPSFGEWDQLEDFLGSAAGGKMKTINRWVHPNIGATNGSGFSAYPAGLRLPNGHFAGSGENTSFWTSSSDTNGYPFIIFLYYQNERMSNTFAFDAREGYSIRCVKD